MNNHPKKLSLEQRALKKNVKTAKGRKISSTRWLARHINDPFVALSKKEQYRSRAAYKIIAIDDKFKIFAKRRCIVDLGAAPGGWSQVSRQRAHADSLVVAIDLKEVAPIEGVTFLQGDFLATETTTKLTQLVQTTPPDLIISDMAANASGDKALDHLRIINLVQAALTFALAHLNTGGHFVAKLLQGGQEKELAAHLRQHFAEVRFFKPEASYADSSEIYIVAKRFNS